MAAEARYIEVRVRPNAGTSALLRQQDGSWRAQLRAAPENGKANTELIALVARHFGCARSAVSIRRGSSGRVKLVKIAAAATVAPK